MKLFTHELSLSWDDIPYASGYYLRHVIGNDHTEDRVVKHDIIKQGFLDENPNVVYRFIEEF